MRNQHDLKNVLEVHSFNQEPKGYYDLLKDAMKNYRPTKLYISSPWINLSGLSKLKKAMDEAETPKSQLIRVVLRASEFKDLDITPPEVFKELKGLADKVEIRLSRNVHAKLLLGEGGGSPFALVTSSNLTDAGFNSNQEAGVLIVFKSPDEYQKFKEIFDTIFNDATPIGEVLGMVINPSKPYSVEFALFKDIPQDSWVKVEMGEDGWLLGRVDRVMKWNRSFFLNPFTQGEVAYFQPIDEFFRTFEIPDHHKDGAIEWHIARGQALIGTTPDIVIATAKIMVHMRNGKDETPRLAPNVGSIVKKLNKDDFVKVFYGDDTDDYENYALGRVISPDEEELPFYINFEEIFGKHMAVHGSTGSGKSFFSKRLIATAWRWIKDKNKPYGIVVIDPHGEYNRRNGKVEDLESVGFPKDGEGGVEVIVVSVLSPEIEYDFGEFINLKGIINTFEEVKNHKVDDLDENKESNKKSGRKSSKNNKKVSVKDVIKKYIKFGGNSKDGQENDKLYSVISNLLNEKWAAIYLLSREISKMCPDMREEMTALQREIGAKILEGSNVTDEEANELIEKIIKSLSEYLDNIKNNITTITKEDNKNESYIEKLTEKLENLEKDGTPFLLIFDLKNIDDAWERVRIAANIMETVYQWSKTYGNGERKILLVMDEAHNFAGNALGQTSKGKENIALTWAKKIAAEGRKFGIGLVIVSQRVKEALDTTVRSQCNTVVLFRLINNNDLEGATESYEGVSGEIKPKLPSLRTGEAFVSGVAVKYPMIVRIKGKNKHLGV